MRTIRNRLVKFFYDHSSLILPFDSITPNNLERLRMQSNRLNEDFEPFCKWRLHDGKETIDIYLQGFREDQLEVQTNSRGKISVTVYGERALDGSKWSCFHTEIRLPEDSNMNEIQTRFSNGILSIEMPTDVHHLVDETEQQNINVAAEANEDETEEQIINLAAEANEDAKNAKRRAFKVALATAAVAVVVALGIQTARLARTYLKFAA